MDLSGHESETPIPITTFYGGGGNGSHVTSHGHDHYHPINPPESLPTTLHHHRSYYDGSQSLSPPTSKDQEHHHHNVAPYNLKKSTWLVFRYRECLKNHAASIGGNATDGCGEFMPGGEEGTLEALKCSACNCHRNFHRKEMEGDVTVINRKLATNKALLISSASDSYYNCPRAAPVHNGHGSHHGHMVMKKRFRTKFTSEQKEKMLGFAERVGWRLQRQEESVVQEFCQEIGVKRRVLKVWMHNNKHNLTKKKSPPQQIQLE